MSDNEKPRSESHSESLWEYVFSNKYVLAQDANDLWITMASYFKWCDNNPLEVPFLIRSGLNAGTTKYMKSPQPYSLDGLCLFCGISIQYLRFIANGKDEALKAVAERALMIVRTQNLNWAMVGVFNPIIASKLNNLGTSDFGNDEDSSVNITVLGQGAPPLLSNENEIPL